jgi:hypothetical protein
VQTIEVPMSDVMQRIHMRVAFRITGQAVFPVRVFIAARLVKLAAWILGCGVEIDDMGKS